MSVTILPYIDDKTTKQLQERYASSQPLSQVENKTSDFQTSLENATRSQQARVVDALIALSDAGISLETLQKLLGSSSSSSVSQAATTASASSSSGGISCPDELESYFQEASAKYDVDINLLKAIAKAESGFDASATSSAGAMGIMQLMPATAKALGISDAYDAHDNIMGGAQVIAQNLKKYNGDISLALAAYNAGSGNVDKYGGIPPFTETQNYVKKVLEYYNNAQA
ncbi:MAG: lytic transglycosylase domain-containing protein [Lachnospiraceae bacterium]|nr:lytic transglycosylase domain-containing protein [Lachnospiraceae bacterium]